MADNSSIRGVYSRIIRYAKPYKGRLFVGILCGLISCGSLYGVLSSSGNLIEIFQKSSAPVSQSSGVDKSENSEDDDEIAKVQAILHKLGFDIKVKTDDGRMTPEFVAMFIFAFPAFYLIYALAIYGHKYYMRWIGAVIVRDMRNDLFGKLQNQSLKFYGKTDIGQLISKCTNDTTLVEQVISATVSAVTVAPVTILAALIFILQKTIENEGLRSVLGLGVLFPICIVPIIILGRYVRKYMHAALNKISDLVSRMHENFTGIRVVKAFNMEKKEASRFLALNQGYFKSVIRALRAELLMTPLMEIVGVVLFCAFIVACYVKQIQLSEIVSIGFASFIAYRPIKQVANINAHLQKGAAALERIFGIMDVDTSIVEADNPVDIKAFNDRIVFNNVEFSYDEEGSKIIDDVSFEIKKGSVVALVGETGSGKSTLANLLARFYDPNCGTVTMDGHDLKDLKLESLRNLVGIVTQDTILFNDTVANNIAYGAEKLVMDDVVDAAKKANAHEFIVADPDGYERVVGEKGFVLSGGEKQRVSVARAILRNPPILILDEATSALDTVTERLVQEAISRVMENRTVFAIAHRLSTIKHADQILLIEKGKIAEQGTHDELYEKGGKYRKLCDMQVLDS